MATQIRRDGLDLIEALRREPHRFRFCQAIRILGLAASKGGGSSLPGRLRFRTPATLAFAPSEITRLDDRGPSAPLEMEVGFLGLTGPAGVLPHHYTETLLERRFLHRDTTLHAFLDLFSHRACCLFFAAWSKYRFQFAYEQGNRDGFTGRLLDLLTVRNPSSGPGLPPEILARFAGALSRRPLPSISLIAFISDYFGLEANLESFAGQWSSVPPGEQTRLGTQGFGLGAGAFLGERLWDRQTKVLLRLGPLDATRFQAFLPGGPGAESLRQFVKMCLGELLACDLELVMLPRTIPSPCLQGRANGSPRLGLDTWLRTRTDAPRSARVAFRLQS